MHTLVAIAFKTLAQTTDAAANNHEVINLEFWQTLFVALASALIGSLGSFVLYVLKRKNAPRKEISYEIDISNTAPKVDASLEDKVAITFNGRMVEGLSLIKCDMINSGNQLINSLHLRFAVPDKNQIIESYLEPNPQEEVGLTTDDDPSSKPNERKYSISYLEPGTRLGFRFIAVGDSPPLLEMYPRSPEGDVKLVQRLVRIELDELAKAKSFVSLFLLYILVIPIFQEISRWIMPAGIFVTAMRLTLVVMMLPFARQFAHVAVGALGSLRKIKFGHQVNVSGNADIGDVIITERDSHVHAPKVSREPIRFS
ncbi:MAG: hypothetical protein GC162_09520 [Planctomycetes bacterium]|nr:hypothetical protein [Planctomycetota bacterium]